MSRRARQDNYRTLEGSMIFRYNTLTGVTGSGSAGGDAVISTDYSLDGDPVVKITTGTTTNNTYAATAVCSQIVSEGPVGAWVYIPSVAALTSIKLYFSSVANLASYAMVSVAANVLQDGWNYVSAKRSEFTLSGGEVWTNTMIRVQIEVKTSGGGTTVYASGVTCGYRARPKVLIGLDDGLASAYSAYEILEARGLKGSFFLIGSLVGTEGYLTLEQCQTIYAAGHDLGNHSWDHVDLTTLTQAEAQANIEQCRDWLVAQGFTRAANYFSHPYGTHNATTRAACVAAGVVVAGGWTRPGTMGTAEGVDDLYQIGCHTMSNALSLATAQAHAQRAYQQGETVVFGGHGIGAVADGTTWTTSDFTALADTVAAARRSGLVDSVTVSEWYDGLTSPAVRHG